MKCVLAVEDEPDIAFVLTHGLKQEGFEVITARSGGEAFMRMKSGEPDLVLLDVMLPDIDGFEMCRCLREMRQRPFPILMLSARSTLTDKIKGLDCGADDYITKPFDLDELLARVRASMRRVKEYTHQVEHIAVGDLVIDTAARQAWRAGELLTLTKKEYSLLELLAKNAGQVLTRDCIFDHVWGWDSEASWEVIKVYVNYLRTKLNAGGKPDMIHSVRGIGYVLRA
ncbi:MAG TPA: response regulator transcription factor [Ktedonobacteraceae bacterium]|nr:response regulator transcription factor [Ktedonobacteraceae bacterium]